MNPIALLEIIFTLIILSNGATYMYQIDQSASGVLDWGAASKQRVQISTEETQQC